MLKKIFIATFMATLIFSQNVSAQEVLVFSDDDDYNYYVITESIINRTEYRDNRTFDVTVRIRYRNDFHSDQFYCMWENDGITWYSEGYGKGMRPIGNIEPMASVWNFCLKFLNLDYTITYN